MRNKVPRVPVPCRLVSSFRGPEITDQVPFRILGVLRLVLWTVFHSHHETKEKKNLIFYIRISKFPSGTPLLDGSYWHGFFRFGSLSLFYTFGITDLGILFCTDFILWRPEESSYLNTQIKRIRWTSIQKRQNVDFLGSNYVFHKKYFGFVLTYSVLVRLKYWTGRRELGSVFPGSCLCWSGWPGHWAWCRIMFGHDVGHQFGPKGGGGKGKRFWKSENSFFLKHSLLFLKREVIGRREGNEGAVRIF